MGAIWIAGRELRAILQTAMGWLVLAGFLFITGFFWATMVTFYVDQSTSMINPMGAQQMNLSDHLLVPFFDNCKVVLLMILPALSMRLFAEEYKQRTMELLMTSPVTSLEIVLGKFLGALGYVTVMLICTLHYPIALSYWGSPEPGVLIGGYLSLLLLSAALLAMGMFYSSTTNNQIVAAVLSFTTGLAIFVLWWVDDNPDSIAYNLSISTHLSDLTSGQLRLSDLVYLGGFIGCFLFAAHQRVEALRWR